MDLTGTWRAAIADEALRRTYPDPDFDDGGWLDLAVPGHWRSVPGFGQVDGSVLYRRRFEHPRPATGSRAWLTFDGVFYQSDVWLDGAYLGDTEGYFAPHIFEITDALADRHEHVLAAEVSCDRQTADRPKRTFTGSFEAGPFAEPDWNPGGIWRPVHIRTTGPSAITSLRVTCIEASAERATLAFDAVVDAAADGDLEVRTGVDGRAPHEQVRRVAAGPNRLGWKVTVAEPRLWWPRALGDPSLVDVEVAIAHAGAVSDERRFVTGLRRITMTDFVTTVNGERLFLKGAAIGPVRPDLGCATTQEVEQPVHDAVAAGLDLLRLSAHVSRSELYDAADRLGLLLWQDLPLHGVYARSARKQAGRQAAQAVDLLGHHPSLAIWCGHDEPFPEEARSPGNATTPKDVVRRGAATLVRPSYTRSVFDRTIERALRRADSSRAVIASSGVPGRDDVHVAFGWGDGEADMVDLASAWPRAVRFVGGFGAPPGGPSLPAGPADDHHRAVVVANHVETLRRLKYRPVGGFTVTGLAPRRSETWAALQRACAPVVVMATQPHPTYAPGARFTSHVHLVSDLREPLPGATVVARVDWGVDSFVTRWTGEVPADAVVRVGSIDLLVPQASGPATIEILLLTDGTDDEADATARASYGFTIRSA